MNKNIEESMIISLKACCECFEDFLNDREDTGFWEILSWAEENIENVMNKIDENSYEDPVIGKAHKILGEIKEHISENHISEEACKRNLLEIRNNLPILEKGIAAMLRENNLNQIFRLQEAFQKEVKQLLQATVDLDISKEKAVNPITKKAIEKFNFEVDPKFKVKGINSHQLHTEFRLN